MDENKNNEFEKISDLEHKLRQSVAFRDEEVWEYTFKDGYGKIYTRLVAGRNLVEICAKLQTNQYLSEWGRMASEQLFTVINLKYVGKFYYF